MSHKKYRTETNCLNCGAEVTGKFCSECGQENLETNDNFLHIAGHFVSDYFHWDAKFFRSLIPFFIRPGFLTKQFWEGRRVHYIDPLRLFFFMTIIFMISTAAVYKQFGYKMKEKMKPTMMINEGALKNLNQEQRDAKIKELKVGNERRMEKIKSGIDDFFGVIKYATFFLLPVYALIFKVLYRRRRTSYVDHLVYTMHLQSFIYFICGIILLLPFIFPSILDILLSVILVPIFIYIVVSLRYLYRQAWWKTILKSALATFSLFIITITVMSLYAVFDAVFFQ